MPATKFGEDQIENMVAVGKVGSSSARIWIRSVNQGDITISIIRNNDTIEQVSLNISNQSTDKTNTYDIQGLSPLTRYEYIVTRDEDNSLIGQGHFETFPADIESTPDKFSIAAMSCHQPFNDVGRLEEKNMRLLSHVKDILKDYGV